MEELIKDFLIHKLECEYIVIKEINTDGALCLVEHYYPDNSDAPKKSLFSIWDVLMFVYNKLQK